MLLNKFLYSSKSNKQGLEFVIQQILKVDN